MTRTHEPGYTDGEQKGTLWKGAGDTDHKRPEITLAKTMTLSMTMTITMMMMVVAVVVVVVVA